jgi:putative (di)nucleoside polyphosphate hydrolase
MKPSGQYFRAGIGAIIVDKRGHVLACERADIPGAWQLPQGGLDPDEEPLQAALREIAEETGIPSVELTPVGHYPDLLAYELPAQARSNKTGRGQVQYWFLFRYQRDTVRLPKESEFKACGWMRFDDLIPRVATFKRPIYMKLATYFSTQLT